MSNEQSKYRQAGKILFVVFTIVSFIMLGGLAFIRIGMPLSVEMITMEASDGSLLMLTTKVGSPQILFYDAQGKVRLELGLSETGTPWASMNDDTGRSVISMDTATRGGQPQIFLRGVGQGEVAWRVSVDEQGKPVITP